LLLVGLFQRLRVLTGVHSTSRRAERLAYGGSGQQFIDLYLPEGSDPAPVVVMLHGGFWRAPYGLSLMAGLSDDLAKRGIAVLNVEYRRIGDRGGGWPNTFLDVALAADGLRTLARSHPLDLGRVVAVGHSAGGHLALWLAARRRLPAGGPLTTPGEPLALRGVVSQAGAADLELVARLGLGGYAAEALVGGTPSEVPERYAAASPAAMLPLGVPQVLVHGSRDGHVPPAMSRRWAAAAEAAGDSVKLVEPPGADHFALIDERSAAWALTVPEIEGLLAP
jgi:acetyl esterase/lipase